MTTQAIRLAGRMPVDGALAPAAPEVVPVPSRDALDAELRGRRVRLVAVFSLCLGVAGVIWALGQGLVALGEGESERMRFMVSTLQSAVLAAGGWFGVFHARLGHLRRATYSNVAALTLSATINLAFIRNAEGAAVAAYAGAVGLAALVMQGREWLAWGAILVGSTAIGAVLHSSAVLPQFDIPHAMAAIGLLFAVTFGLGVPLWLFWLFSRDLTASHDRAWALTSEAAEAHHLASERAAQLEQRSEQLQAKNAELNDFLYVVSHDLRAPLINLEGFSRALQDSVRGLDDALASARPTQWPELKGDIDESLEFIVRSAGKMDFLVQGLLDLSRIDSRPNLAQRVELRAVVDTVLDSLHYMIDTRGIEVRVDPLPVVVGDPVRINQVFGNLLDNAVKYMKPEGEASIHVGCTRHAGRTQFFVRDTGVGIRPADQAKIFRLFSRVGGHTVPGDGMGLTTVKKIIEKHDGKIWVDSALGQGSTFWFTLPGRQADAQEEDERGTVAAADYDLAS